MLTIIWQRSIVTNLQFVKNVTKQSTIKHRYACTSLLLRRRCRQRWQTDDTVYDKVPISQWAFFLIKLSLEFWLLVLLVLMAFAAKECLRSLNWRCLRITSKKKNDKALDNKKGRVDWRLSTPWASLVAQWLRICLPMQRTWVRALVWEDPTCRRATKPVRHNYWACALEPTGHNYWARVPQLLKPAHLEPVLCNKRSHSNEKPVHRN